MSAASYSAQASAAFVRDHKRQPKLLTEAGKPDAAWLSGYDACRRDNAAAMALMEEQIRKLQQPSDA